MIVKKKAAKKSLAVTLVLSLLLPAASFAQVARVTPLVSPVSAPAFAPVITGAAASTLKPLAPVSMPAALLGVSPLIAAPAASAAKRAPVAVAAAKALPAGRAHSDILAFAEAVGDADMAGSLTAQVFDNSKAGADEAGAVEAGGAQGEMSAEAAALVKAYEARVAKRLAAFDAVAAKAAKVKSGRFSIKLVQQPMPEGKLAIGFVFVVDGQELVSAEVGAKVASGEIPKAEWIAAQLQLIPLVKALTNALLSVLQANAADRQAVQKKMALKMARTLALKGVGELRVADAADLAAAPTAALTRQKMLATLYQVAAVFSEQYAPMQWKQEQFKVDLKREYEKARSAIASAPQITTREFQDVLYNLTAAMRDYHVSIRFSSTESAVLPFSVTRAGDKYFLAYIDREKLPMKEFPFRQGDEVVAFSGQSTDAAVRALAVAKGENVSETDLRLAEMMLTNRRRARGDQVPRGKVQLVIRRQDGKLVKVAMPWDYTPELVAQDVPVRDAAIGAALDALSPDKAGLEHVVDRFLTGLKGTAAAVSSGAGSLLSRLGAKLEQASHPLIELFETMRRESEGNPFMLGARKSFVPRLGEIVWQSEEKNHFHAYIFKTKDGRKAGFIRISSYEGGPKAVKSFGEIMAKFQAETDSLIIDQVNNPGGSVPYLYALASHLTDRPLKTAQHHLIVDAGDAHQSADMLLRIMRPQKQNAPRSDEDKEDEKTFDGYPITQAFMMEMIRQAQFILKQFNAGKRFTDLTPIQGVDEIEPAPNPAQRFTKPILLLTNALDFSGGDFFPALLQDNKRVTILGVRTAGAGGYVRNYDLPNQFGIEDLHATGSLAIRANGQPIENLGVTPDIPYDLTEKDLRTGFAQYRYTILQALRELMGPSVSTPLPSPGK